MAEKQLTYFVSYSRADQAYALQLAEQLRSKGIDLWIDQLDIVAGERWDRAVQEALEAAPGLLVLLSQTSIKSDNVLDEVSYAMNEGMRIIPVLIENCEVPFRLQRLQYIDLTANFNQGFARLLQNFDLETSPGGTGWSPNKASQKPFNRKVPSPSNSSAAMPWELKPRGNSKIFKTLAVLVGLAIVVVVGTIVYISSSQPYYDPVYDESAPSDWSDDTGADEDREAAWIEYQSACMSESYPGGEFEFYNDWRGVFDNEYDQTGSRPYACG